MTDKETTPPVEAAEALKPSRRSVKKTEPLPPKGSAAYKAKVLRGEIKE